VTLLDIVVLLAGAAVAVAVFLSAVQTVVVPRGVPVRLTRAVFLFMRRIFEVRVRFAKDYESRDRAYALYAPLTLVTLPVVWLVIVLGAYTAIFWAIGIHPLRMAFITSGSSLLTLGFAGVPDLPSDVVALSEAVFGLVLLALLITYLPSMYGAFSRREVQVALVATFAGSPPWAIPMLERFHRIDGLDRLEEQVFEPWTVWFVEVEETHTSLSALPFFRSPQADRSWITAAGTVLDGAALYASTLDAPRSPPGELCIRTGYLALREIANLFDIRYDPAPKPDDPISIARDEFDAAYDRLAANGLPLRADRDQAWRDFAGWRVNYDNVLVTLAGMIRAPYAPWSSDRSAARPYAPPMRRRRP
jgi:hypothetical protein